MHIAGVFAGALLTLQAVAVYGQQTTATREDRWRQDIEFIATTIKQTHPQPFAKISQAEFDDLVRELIGKIGQSNDLQMNVWLNRITSRMGDASSFVAVVVSPRGFSIRLQWLSDGWYVTDAGSTNLRMLGRKVTSIAGLPVAQVVEMAAALFPHENESGIVAAAGSFLVSPDLLLTMGVISNNTAPVEYEFVDADGNAVSHIVQLDGTALFPVSRKARPAAPLHRRSTSYYWFEYLEAEKLLYIQYNFCSQDPVLPMREFTDELVAAVSGKPVDRVVYDLRNNRGGTASVTTQLLRAMREAKEAGVLDPKESYAITSRFTFGAGLLAAVDLKAAGAKIVGEAPGARLSHFGEARAFATPNYRIPFSVSTREFLLGQGDLVPDLRSDVTIDVYRRDVDPFLETILNQ